MRCFKCNREIDEAVGKCTFCEEKDSEAVRIISKEEIVEYQGVTIDTDSEQEKRRHSYETDGGRQQIFVRKISVGNSSWLTRLLTIVIFAAIAAFLLFVALPVALIGIGVGIVVWLVLSFLRG